MRLSELRCRHVCIFVHTNTEAHIFQPSFCPVPTFEPPSSELHIKPPRSAGFVAQTSCQEPAETRRFSLHKNTDFLLDRLESLSPRPSATVKIVTGLLPHEASGPEVQLQPTEAVEIHFRPTPNPSTRRESTARTAKVAAEGRSNLAPSVRPLDDRVTRQNWDNGKHM
ncbi:unnamed protein product [Protopolystoma xenopodis]|uniref:Uncharacterized protein n=1 Tax=Protopolystoma xenopodis TaxID=117903 RepID=A0A3S5CMI4_9PLAT|nr:unnamed protein product [Protopolystoma xenopodis]